MNIFLLLTIAMLMIILMLRRHIPIGPCMLTSGIFIWLMKAPELPYLVQALRETLTMPRTYDTLRPLRPHRWMADGSAAAIDSGVNAPTAACKRSETARAA